MNRSIIKITENFNTRTSIEIVPAGGEVWMTKPEIAYLLMVYQNTIGNNLRAIFKAGILNEKDAVKEYRYKEQDIERITVYYNLETIITLCYRIRTFQAETIRKLIQTEFYNRNNNKPESYILHNLSVFSLN
ncbi:MULTISPECIES: hypothetical protein [unclassified Dysgonomonas]|uniref:hypothetical protein n=1 Tax=unclassified Dysgonomonas TaxID=2630389 RepID=UPI0013EDAF11|nr:MULTISPECIES: hypothetical protein [unclassified Dysgonomonas]